MRQWTSFLLYFCFSFFRFVGLAWLLLPDDRVILNAACELIIVPAFYVFFRYRCIAGWTHTGFDSIANPKECCQKYFLACFLSVVLLFFVVLVQQQQQHVVCCKKVPRIDHLTIMRMSLRFVYNTDSSDGPKGEEAKKRRTAWMPPARWWDMGEMPIMTMRLLLMHATTGAITLNKMVQQQKWGSSYSTKWQKLRWFGQRRWIKANRKKDAPKDTV